MNGYSVRGEHKYRGRCIRSLSDNRRTVRQKEPVMSYNKQYHRFFEDYAEKLVTDPKTGKTRIKRIYTGWYYRHDLEDREWKILKLRYILLYIFSLAAFLVLAAQQGAESPAAVIPQMFGILAFVWLGFYVAAYATHKRMIGVRAYRDRKTLCSTAAGAAILTGILLAEQIYTMISTSDFSARFFAGTILGAAAAAALILLFRTEWNMEYIRVENTAAADDDSYNIRNMEMEER